MSNNKNRNVARLAGYFKGLSHPHRLRIFLDLFARCRPGVGCCPESTVTACVGDLGRPLAIAPSTVSHHLKELRQCGLLMMERQGKTVECWINPQVLKDLAILFSPDACGVNAKKRRSAS
jgi:ArsR family transcriptional regulator, arsenate/arsenite/antimonite-responsive transcriptional repressor